MRAARTFLLLLALLPMLSNNCKKEAECETVLSAPQDFIDYWHFPEGSWWVYRLQGDSTAVDTVRVVNSSDGHVKPGTPEAGEFPTCEKIYQMLLDHSNRQYFASNPTYKRNGQLFFDGQTWYARGKHEWRLTLSGDVAISVSGWILSYPFIIGDRYENGIYLADTLPHSISGQTYPQIVHIHEPKREPERSRYYRDLYFAKNVGIIKQVISTGEVWELDTFCINK